jgi:hypothetical protein
MKILNVTLDDSNQHHVFVDNEEIGICDNGINIIEKANRSVIIFRNFSGGLTEFMHKDYNETLLKSLRALKDFNIITAVSTFINVENSLYNESLAKYISEIKI